MKCLTKVALFICTELLEVVFCAILLLGIIGIVRCLGDSLVLAIAVAGVFALTMLVAYFSVAGAMKRKKRDAL